MQTAPSKTPSHAHAKPAVARPGPLFRRLQRAGGAAAQAASRRP